MRSHHGHSAADAAAASIGTSDTVLTNAWPCPTNPLRSKSAGLMNTRSVCSVMHPCAQRLWMPVPCSQTKPAKICSVNFRPFSAYKERSEFETVPCPPKSLHSFYARPRSSTLRDKNARPCHPILRDKSAALPPKPPRQGCRPSGVAFRRFRDATMRVAPMDASAMFPDKDRKKSVP